MDPGGKEVTAEDVGERIRRFDELVERAAMAHEWTYCAKVRMRRLTEKLRGEECVPCIQFVVNGGSCDPL